MDRRLYAFLRYTEDETILVLINMSKDQIRDYRFCLSEGPLRSGSAQEVLRDIEIAGPLINDSGGFDSYQPIEMLDAYTTYIIELE